MKEPRIMQIIPAHDTVAVFGWRDIDADGTIKEQITERLPVICWALVTDDEFYVRGMVAQEAGEIILVNQWDDFLEYETAYMEALSETTDNQYNSSAYLAALIAALYEELL